jgi:adenylate kinase family enzyme
MPAQPCRLLVTGASGSGTTTLGGALASAWAVPHADVDDYYWVPTDPPFAVKRPPAERLDLMAAVFIPRDAWVLSGSIMGWGEPLIPRLDGVVFVSLDAATRMQRLEARESSRYGASVPDETAQREFMDWARGYDDPEFSGRSRARHEAWLSSLPCPVLRLDSARPVAELVNAVMPWRLA